MKHDSTTQRLSRTPRLFLYPVAACRYVIPCHGAVVARLWRLRIPASDACGTESYTADSDDTTVYAIELRGLGSRRFCLLAGDEARGREILSLVARNTVTPCGLRDVLEEL